MTVFILAGWTARDIAVGDWRRDFNDTRLGRAACFARIFPSKHADERGLLKIIVFRWWDAFDFLVDKVLNANDADCREDRAIMMIMHFIIL